jgi:transporter family protein
MEKWIIYAILSMVFAGVTAVVAKFGMNDLNSDNALAVRTTVVLILVLINAFMFRNAFTELQHTSGKNLMLLAVSGVCTTLSWIFYYRAMKLGPVSYVASIDKASIVVTLLLSFLFLKEPLTATVIAGAAFILTGMLILVWK